MTAFHFAGEAARRFTVEPLGPRVLIRGMFFHQAMRITVRDARYPVLLEVEIVDGRPACTRIDQIRRRVRLDTGDLIDRGPVLTGTFLRSLPLQTLLEEAAMMTAIDATPRRISRNEIDPTQELNLEVDARDEVAVLLPAHTRAGGLQSVRKALATERVKPHRGKRLTDERLGIVAEVYRSAVRDGKPPTQTVQEVLFVSRSTAGRWVQEARARGKLGPAPRQRVGGETHSG